MTATPLNHYQVLMVDPEVDADVLMTVFRRLVQRYQSPLDQSPAAMQRLRAVYEAYTIRNDPRRRARYDAQLEDLMWDPEPAPPAGLARADTRPHAATVAHPAAPTPVRVPAVAPAPSKVATAAPSSAREAFSRATASPQPTLTAVPVGAPRPSANRSVQVSVLDFGRYAGWSLRQLAARDPNYLEWLLRSPGGRQYHAEITALLQAR